MIDTAFIGRVHAIVGERGVITNQADIAPYVRDWRGTYIGKTSLVVRPSNTQEVAAVVALCAESTPSFRKAAIPAWSAAAFRTTPIAPSSSR